MGGTVVEFDILIILVGVACVAGFVDAIAGGGGLLTLPALLLAGLSPVEAVATNKLQGSFGVATSSYAFWRSGHVDLRELRPAIAATAIGAVLGALAVHAADPNLLRKIVPLALIAVAVYFALTPNLEGSRGRPLLSPTAFALGMAGPIGFYDGFLGPGAGSLYVLAFVLIAAQGLLQATANTKILNLTSNLVSLMVFLIAGSVVFTVGLPMAVGQALGSWLGAKLAMCLAARLIRPLLVIVSVSMALRLFVGDD